MLPLRTVIPTPACVTLPDPLMLLPRVSVSLRFITSEALFTTEELPRFPFVPPLPTWSTPAEIVVTPEKPLLSPVRMEVPEPS